MRPRPMLTEHPFHAAAPYKSRHRLGLVDEERPNSGKSLNVLWTPGHRPSGGAVHQPLDRTRRRDRPRKVLSQLIRLENVSGGVSKGRTDTVLLPLAPLISASTPKTNLLHLPIVAGVPAGNDAVGRHTGAVGCGSMSPASSNEARLPNPAEIQSGVKAGPGRRGGRHGAALPFGVSPAQAVVAKAADRNARQKKSAHCPQPVFQGPGRRSARTKALQYASAESTIGRRGGCGRWQKCNSPWKTYAVRPVIGCFVRAGRKGPCEGLIPWGV